MLQAEQGLANVALHVANLQKEVAQRESKLRAAERQRRVQAALDGQLPRLQQWHSMQVVQSLFSAWKHSPNSACMLHVHC